jgi:hypothetical protein
MRVPPPPTRAAWRAAAILAACAVAACDRSAGDGSPPARALQLAAPAPTVLRVVSDVERGAGVGAPHAAASVTPTRARPAVKPVRRAAVARAEPAAVAVTPAVRIAPLGPLVPLPSVANGAAAAAPTAAPTAPIVPVRAAGIGSPTVSAAPESAADGAGDPAGDAPTIAVLPRQPGVPGQGDSCIVRPGEAGTTGGVAGAVRGTIERAVDRAGGRGGDGREPRGGPGRGWGGRRPF